MHEFPVRLTMAQVKGSSDIDTAGPSGVGEGASAMFKFTTGSRPDDRTGTRSRLSSTRLSFTGKSGRSGALKTPDARDRFTGTPQRPSP